MKFFRSKKAFTLVEVIVGIVIIGMVSTSSWFGAATLMKVNEISRNRSIAVNLLQKSQEEVKRSAKTQYDILETCQFASAGVNICGFDDITANFPGFTRTLLVTQEQSSGELKRAKITVSWPEFGQNKQLDSIVLIARPPEALPGNLVGRVMDSSGQATQLVSGAQIKITAVSGTRSFSTLSLNALNTKGANYDFAEKNTGRYLIPPGTWNLTATHPAYLDYTHPTTVVVDTTQETTVDIFMDSKPADVKILGKVYNHLTGSPIQNFNSAGIYIFENGTEINKVLNQPNYSFKLSFPNPNIKSRCFTVLTSSAFQAGYAYPVLKGGAPSCLFDYNPDGWSSAVVQADSSLTCSNPYSGGPASGGNDPDRVCVTAGDPDTILDMPLDPVPEVLIAGRVVDSNGNVIPNAAIQAKWPARRSANWAKNGIVQTVKSDAFGNFIFSVPAVQGLFPNGTPNQFHLEVWATGLVDVLSCCDQQQKENRRSPSIFVGPLFSRDPMRNVGDLVIPITQQCGNAQGKIFDAKANNGIPAAKVQVYSIVEVADGVGQYIYQCPGPGYRLRTGTSNFIAQQSGYYTYSSAGNQWYATQPGIVISANQVTNYDARLWPQGFGTIEGTVRDMGTRNPIPLASVELTLYDGSKRTLSTDINGRYSFNVTPETWPPSGLPANDLYFKYSPLVHTITVAHSSGIYLPATKTVNNLNGGQTLTVNFDLATQGNM